MRIVSLLPSATETLFALGVGDQVVGVTHECDYPAAAAARPSLTERMLPSDLPAPETDEAVAEGVADVHTIYRLNSEALQALEPDIVITQRLCEVCAPSTEAVTEAVCSMPTRARVISSDPKDLEAVFTDIVAIGTAVGVEDRADELVRRLRRRVFCVHKAIVGRAPVPTLVLEWPDPPYTAGHWVPDMISAAGGVSVLGTSGEKARRVTWQEVAGTEPEVVVLAYCGLDLDATLREAGQIADVPEWQDLHDRAEVVAVNGSAYFSRPGPRLVDGIDQLAFALHCVDELESAQPDLLFV